ncbi:MAG TPA: efflux RND transporter periplasmic adaptor subunit, partial [Edaphobacter sp.]|nr:efflux RND transporter periplasmic adaptor subunit [Edaphobacter sp.]
TAKSGQVAISVSEQTAQQIATESAKITKESNTLRVPGRIVLPDNASWRVGILVEGRIESVFANLGDFVRKGQVLARVHSHDIHEARAAYQMAVSERARVQAVQALSQKNYDRVQRLFALKAASVQEVEQTKQELVNAETAAGNAATVLERERVHLEDTLGIPADGGTSASSPELELIPIKSPADGYVLQKNITPGATIQPSMDAFVVGALQRLWMLASVPEENLSQLHLGQAATINLQDAGQNFAGHVTNLGQQSDPTTRLVPVRIDVANTNNRLRPEMLATAQIAIGSAAPMLLVAQDAIQQVNGADVVFVRTAPERFDVRPVRRGVAVGERVQILEGIQAGDLIVTRGSFIVKSQLLKSSFQGE